MQNLEAQGVQDPDCSDMSNIYLGLFLNKVSDLESPDETAETDVAPASAYSMD